MSRDFDKFENPSYSGSDKELFEPTIGDRIAPITDAMKKYRKAIIAIIIIVVVAYFAYDFFVGSYRTINFSAKNTEGQGISASSFKVFDTIGNKLFESGGSKTFSVKLKPGEYKIEAKAGPDYKALNTTITVSGDAEEKIELEKNINAEISGFAENFPKSLVAGQTISFGITVENKGSESEEIEFVLSKELEKISIQAPGILVPENSAETATITVTVPDSIKITNLEQGDSLSGSIRIKYTNIKENLPSGVKIFPKPIIEVSPSSISLSGDAGEDVIKDFKVENQSTFTVYDLNLAIEITTISKNSEEQILSSIAFTQGNNISSLPGKKTRQNEFANKLRFNIPITAKAETITANLVIDSQMLPAPVKWPITLKIAREADFGLSVTPSTKSITINFDEDTGLFETKLASLRVQNTGEMDLHNIHVETKNRTVCHTSWLRYKESEISVLPKGQTYTLPIEITAPPSSSTAMNCKIRYWYDNPISIGERVESEIPDWIQITPKTG